MTAPKPILYAVTMVLLVLMIAGSPAPASARPNDYQAGYSAGFHQAANDTRFYRCSPRYNDAERLGKRKLRIYVSRLERQKQSKDYIRGFKRGFEKHWMIITDNRCDN